MDLPAAILPLIQPTGVLPGRHQVSTADREYVSSLAKKPYSCFEEVSKQTKLYQLYVVDYRGNEVDCAQS